MNTGQLILSAVTILLAARALGWIFQRIGQRRVVDEMTAGVSWPFFSWTVLSWRLRLCFPSSSLPVLTALSQLGSALHVCCWS